jgi:hypothetical protein
MDGVKEHCAAYIVPSLISHLHGDGLTLGRNVLHSIVQYTTKIAVFGGSCPSVPIKVSRFFPAGGPALQTRR